MPCTCRPCLCHDPPDHAASACRRAEPQLGTSAGHLRTAEPQLGPLGPPSAGTPSPSSAPSAAPSAGTPSPSSAPSAGPSAGTPSPSSAPSAGPCGTPSPSSAPSAGPSAGTPSPSSALCRPARLRPAHLPDRRAPARLPRPPHLPDRRAPARLPRPPPLTAAGTPVATSPTSTSPTPSSSSPTASPIACPPARLRASRPTSYLSICDCRISVGAAAWLRCWTPATAPALSVTQRRRAVWWRPGNDSMGNDTTS